MDKNYLRLNHILLIYEFNKYEETIVFANLLNYLLIRQEFKNKLFRIFFSKVIERISSIFLNNKQKIKRKNLFSYLAFFILFIKNKLVNYKLRLFKMLQLWIVFFQSIDFRIYIFFFVFLSSGFLSFFYFHLIQSYFRQDVPNLFISALVQKLKSQELKAPIPLLVLRIKLRYLMKQITALIYLMEDHIKELNRAHFNPAKFHPISPKKTKKLQSYKFWFTILLVLLKKLYNLESPPGRYSKKFLKELVILAEKHPEWIKFFLESIKNFYPHDGNSDM